MPFTKERFDAILETNVPAELNFEMVLALPSQNVDIPERIDRNALRAVQVRAGEGRRRVLHGQAGAQRDIECDDRVVAQRYVNQFHRGNRGAPNDNQKSVKKSDRSFFA